MDINTFMIEVYCIVDDFLKDFLQGKRLRQRGPRPTVSDSEVLAIEIVGEFLGFDQDKTLFWFFRQYYGEWFPGLRKIHRTTFVRQAANLWKVKEKFWKHLLTRVEFDASLSIVDSFPLPICRFARANRCRRLRDIAAYGYDEVARQTFLGLRTHLRICWPGVIVDHRLVAANIHDVPVAVDMLTHTRTRGYMLADRNYWNPDVAKEMQEQGLQWLTPFKSSKREKFSWPISLKHKRYRIETIIGQITTRFNIKRVWARDAWHLLSRWLRKVACHTVSVFLCQKMGLPPLQFASLVDL
jgi:hypothetical protein